MPQRAGGRRSTVTAAGRNVDRLGSSQLACFSASFGWLRRGVQIAGCGHRSNGLPRSAGAQVKNDGLNDM